MAKYRRLPDRFILLALFGYEPGTGLLIRRIATSNAVTVGDVVGSIGAGGYLRVNVENKLCYVHRVIWKMITGEDADEIDHIDGIRTNNRWLNLRSVTRVINQKNCARAKNNTSGVVGVHWCGRDHKWVANVGLTVSPRRLYFDSFERAVAARKDAERELGFHANHGRNPKINGAFP